MAHLKHLASEVISPPFPQAQFEIVGEVPAAQCSEAQIEGDSATTSDGELGTLSDEGKFAGWALTGKVCHITASVGGNTGDFNITGHDDNTLLLDANPGYGDPVTYHITDGGELILTRNEASFAAFIRAAGYAYTFKGGKLFTDMPSGQLKDACTILFDPIT